MDVFSNASGNIFVADTKNGRIQIMDRDGTVTSMINLKALTGQATYPSSISRDEGSGGLFVVDSQNDRLLVLNSQGNLISTSTL